MASIQYLQLLADRPQVLVARRDRELAILDGTVWLTVAGEQDIFLAAGERYRLSTRGKTLVEAVRGAARARVQPIECNQPTRWMALFRRLQATWRCRVSGTVPAVRAARF